MTIDTAEFSAYVDTIPVEAAAKYLGCSVRKVRDLYGTGEIRGVRIGKRIQLDFVDLKAWRDEQMNRPPMRRRRQRAS